MSLIKEKNQTLKKSLTKLKKIFLKTFIPEIRLLCSIQFPNNKFVQICLLLSLYLTMVNFTVQNQFSSFRIFELS